LPLLHCVLNMQRSPLAPMTQAPFLQLGVLPLQPPQHSVAAMHPPSQTFCPVGQLRQAESSQYAWSGQSPSSAHGVRQPSTPQGYSPQSMASAVAQSPSPSQVPAGVKSEPEQMAAAQIWFAP
jgi:hypothetical protein